MTDILEGAANLDIEALLIAQLMGGQQDPNATANLVNAIVVSKLAGEGSSSLKSVLLATMLMNTTSQQAAAGTTGAVPVQNNMLPLLLALTLGKEEDPDKRRKRASEALKLVGKK